MGLMEGLGGVVGGILGNNAAKMDRAHQKDLMNQTVEEYRKMGYPPDYAREIIVEELKRQGNYTPELEQDLNDTMAESLFKDLAISPETRESQMQALGIFKQLGKVGLGAEDRAALNQIRNEQARDTEAKRQQILQRMQATGMGGSGAELMAQLGAVQQGADLASQQADATMAQASSARRQAIEQMGRMAGEVRSSDYNQAADRARALDERNKFLQQNAIERQRSNVGISNDAQMLNYKEQQRIAEANVAARNAEKARQRKAEEAQYRDKLAYTAGITDQQTALAGYHGATANAKAQSQMNMAKGVGAGADAGIEEAGGLAAVFSDKNLKTHIDYTDDDVQNWLDSLSMKVAGKKRI